MSYTITLTQDFPIQGGFIGKGRYKVPEQLSEKIAQKAMANGLADKSLPTLSLKGKKRRTKKG